MKYQSIEAFEKHLKQSFPHHLSGTYLVTAAVDYDRKKLLEVVIDVFQQRNPEISKERFSLQEKSLSEVLLQFDMQDLFAKETCYIIDSLEKAKAAELEKLARFITNPSPEQCIVLGASSIKGLSQFYSQVKNELTVLDLSEEKPWERQKRIADWVSSIGMKLGKRIHPEACNLLLEQVGMDVALLEQEVNKLACFVGDKNSIDISDVRAISSSRDLLTSWQIAEGLVWQEKPIESDATSDLNLLIPLLGQIRYHLEIGYQLAVLIEKKVAPSSFAQQFPNVRPNQLEKYISIAKQRHSPFFKQALSYLFDLEVKLKSSGLEPEILWDIFYSKFTLLKIYEYEYTHSPS